MRFAAKVVEASDTARATADAIRALEAELSPDEIHLVIAFASGADADGFQEMGLRLRQSFPAATIVGCTAMGVIGGDLEIEGRGAVSLLAGNLPGARVRAFTLPSGRIGPGVITREALGLEADGGSVLAIADPFCCDIQGFLDGVNDACPGLPLVGGLASGQLGSNRCGLLLDGEVVEDGLIGVGLSGAVRLETVVSQGCRPIGRHYVITKGDRNVIGALAGRPAVEVLQEMIKEIPDADRQLLKRGLFVGRVIDEYKSTFERGDFHIQGVLGIHPEGLGIVIGGPANQGTTIQFHVRDADSADEDLRALLAPHALSAGASPPRGALLFSCNGRGTQMWTEPGHDVSVLRELCGDVPASGFFCAGELGPIGGQSFVHGFTASIGLFRCDGD